MNLKLGGGGDKNKTYRSAKAVLFSGNTLSVLKEGRFFTYFFVC
jgi:hypothetical protein